MDPLIRLEEGPIEHHFQPQIPLPLRIKPGHFYESEAEILPMVNQDHCFAHKTISLCPTEILDIGNGKTSKLFRETNFGPSHQAMATFYILSTSPQETSSDFVNCFNSPRRYINSHSISMEVSTCCTKIRLPSLVKRSAFQPGSRLAIRSIKGWIWFFFLIKLEGPWPLQGVESDFLITSSRKEALQDIYRENPAAHKGGVPGHG